MSLAGIPAAELPLIPAGTPPNGTLSNFIDPPSRANVYIATAAIFLALATISVLMRLYIRLIVQKSPWWDDLIAVLALLCQATYTGLNTWLCVHGVGKHMWNVRLIDLLPLITPARVMADMTEPSIGLTKLTLLLLYYRLFNRDNVVKIGILIGIVFIFTVYTTLMFLFIFLDTTQTNDVNKTMAVVNVVTDTYILILPVSAVMKLYLPMRKKIGLAFVFATGAFCVVMATVGCVYRIRFADHGADFTYGLLDVILVNQIECCVGIMCACMPLFPAILNKTHLISSDWLISMRSLRDRFFRSSARSSPRPSANGKSTDDEDFVALKEQPSGASSLKDLSRNNNAVTHVQTSPQGYTKTAQDGIEVTTAYAVDRS